VSNGVHPLDLLTRGYRPLRPVANIWRHYWLNPHILADMGRLAIVNPQHKNWWIYEAANMFNGHERLSSISKMQEILWSSAVGSP